MNILFDVASFAISLAVNMFLIGLLISVGIAAGFSVIRNIAPRVRYVIALVAFVISVTVPLFLTLDGSLTQIVFPKNPVQQGLVQEDQNIETDTNSFDVGTIVDPQPAQIVDEPVATAQPAFLDNLVIFASNNLFGRIFSIVWLVGSIFFLYREFSSHWKSKKERKTLQYATIAERAELSVPVDIQLYFSQKESPYTVGLLYPVIVMPRRFSAVLSRAAIDCIIRHEAAHVKWRDPLVNSLVRGIRSLFWINPALWFLGYVAKYEQEAGADSEVLRQFSCSSESSREITEYAVLLLSLAKLSGQAAGSGRRNLTVTYLGGSTSLEYRIRRILTGYLPTVGPRIFLASTIFLASLLTTAFIPVASTSFRVVEDENAESNLGESGVSVISTSAGEYRAADSESLGDPRLRGANPENPISLKSETKDKSSRASLVNTREITGSERDSLTNYSAGHTVKTADEPKQLAGSADDLSKRSEVLEPQPTSLTPKPESRPTPEVSSADRGAITNDDRIVTQNIKVGNQVIPVVYKIKVIFDAKFAYKPSN